MRANGLVIVEPRFAQKIDGNGHRTQRPRAQRTRGEEPGDTGMQSERSCELNHAVGQPVLPRSDVRRRLYLFDDRVGNSIQKLVLGPKVSIKRHRTDTELLGQTPHRQASQASFVDQAQRRVNDAFLRESSGPSHAALIMGLTVEAVRRHRIYRRRIEGGPEKPCCTSQSETC